MLGSSSEHLKNEAHKLLNKKCKLGLEKISFSVMERFREMFHIVAFSRTAWPVPYLNLLLSTE